MTKKPRPNNAVAGGGNGNNGAAAKQQMYSNNNNHHHHHRSSGNISSDDGRPVRSQSSSTTLQWEHNPPVVGSSQHHLHQHHHHLPQHQHILNDHRFMHVDVPSTSVMPSQQQLPPPRSVLISHHNNNSNNPNHLPYAAAAATSASPDSGSSSFSSPEMMPAALMDDGYASSAFPPPPPPPPPPQSSSSRGSVVGAPSLSLPLSLPGVGVGIAAVQVYSGQQHQQHHHQQHHHDLQATASAATASDDETSVHGMEMSSAVTTSGGRQHHLQQQQQHQHHQHHHHHQRAGGSNEDMVFEELDGLLGGAGAGGIRSHKSSGLWELGMQEPDFTFSLDGAAYQSLNMDSSMYRSLMNSSSLATSYLAQTRTLPSADLHTHLLDLGLIAQAIQPYGSVQTSERIHPGVKNVLYAMGAQWSTHPDLIREYGSRMGAVKRFLQRAEECFAARNCDTPATVQGMLALGAMYYKVDDGQKACTWTVQACNVAEHMGYNRTAYRSVVYSKPPSGAPEDLGAPSSQSQLAVGHNMGEEALFESEKDVRWNVYAMALENDTFLALASTFAFTIAEQDATHLLYEMRPWERTREQQVRREHQAREERRNVRMAGPTIFDEGAAAPSAATTTGSNTTTTTAAGAAAGANTTPITPAAPLPLQRFLANVKPSQEVALHMQMSFLLRRIMRYLRAPTPVRPDVDEGYVGRGAAACLALAPPQADTNLLHESLMMWYASLPPHCRVWESLAEFRQPPAERPTHGVPTSSTTDQDRHCLYVFLLTLSLLHNSQSAAQRWDAPHQQTYRIDDRRSQHPHHQASIRATSREMLTISRRATAHLLRAAYGANNPLPRPAPLVVDPCTYPALAAAMPYGAHEDGGVPAPPVQIGMLPMVGIGIMLVVQAELGTAVAELLAAKAARESGGRGGGGGSGGEKNNDNNNNNDDGDDVLADRKTIKSAMDMPYADVLADCQEIFLPVLDSQARHSPVDMDYALQIRVLLQELFGDAVIKQRSGGAVDAAAAAAAAAVAAPVVGLLGDAGAPSRGSSASASVSAPVLGLPGGGGHHSPQAPPPMGTPTLFYTLPNPS
ncbi:hypothetical protein HDU86_007252 [Geranomyces michiganensis]|nr:hypothetical protein HDU86_007252 [Geranomyces michiganensis]